jgi:hypothetical protein
MAGIRAWTAAVVFACLLLPAAAAAKPHQSAEQRPVYAPGDQVPFEVPDSRRGDAYEVFVENDKVADGVDDTEKPGVSGEFTMPDLGGKAREVTVLIEVTDATDGSNRSYKGTVDYKPSPPADASPASEPAPPRPEPRPSPPSQAPRPASTPAPPTAAPVPVSPVPGGPIPVTPPEPVGQVLRTPERVLRGLAKAAPLRHRGSRTERRKAKRHARRARRKANDVRQGKDPTAPKVRSLTTPRDTRVDLSDEDFPGLGYSVAWQLLAAVGGAGVLLTLLLGARARRRRRDAEAEAELQEMVSEGRARSHLLR